MKCHCPSDRLTDSGRGGLGAAKTIALADCCGVFLADCYSKEIANKRGLATALHSGDPAFEGLPDYFRDKFEPALRALLDSTTAAGKIRKDFGPYDLLLATGNLSVFSGEGRLKHVQRMVGLLIEGLLRS